MKNLLWHGSTEEALERSGNLIIDLSLIQARCAVAAKIAVGVSGFETYIRSNSKLVPNFGERRRQGETISTALVESTINQLVNCWFVKKKQIGWIVRGTHLLLQTRTKVLNDELEDVYRRWYPRFRAKLA